MIPASGASRGLLRKNLVPLAGKPLLTYTLEAALASRRLDRVILSTDDDEIATIAHGHGVEVPFRRPPGPWSLLTMREGSLSPLMDGPTVTRRQDKHPVYARNGPAVWVGSPDLIRSGSLYGPRTMGLEMSQLESVDIDSAEDLLLAELLLNHQRSRP